MIKLSESHTILFSENKRGQLISHWNIEVTKKKRKKNRTTSGFFDN